jgi:NADPH-dependent F420 reductase
MILDGVRYISVTDGAGSHPTPMNIGILGSGNVGGTLGERWAKAGHTVIFGSRNPASQEMQDLAKRSGATARVESLESAAQSSEVVVVTLPWGPAKGVLQSLDLKGKIVLDCMNPLKHDLSGLEIGTTTSAGEMVAQWTPGASVVKIFNNTGYNNMADPNYNGDAASMFYCGDDPAAKAVASRLAADLGFDPIDSGPLENARLLEPMAMLWIWLAIKGGKGVNIAYRLLSR